jgi:RNase H-like domain found in reverse transcriptase/Integrase zinc binding domain/Reverse transcriptase (RNA-dependent DNA polymerase)
MGISCAPDFSQEVMEEIFHDLHTVETYLDDIGCFSEHWDEHIRLLQEVLQRLQDNNFIVNPLKCEWAVQETEFLGHWITPTGIKPTKKKVQAILNLLPPTNLRQLRSFIGAVTYYRDMFPRRSHIMAPLTGAVSKFTWGPEQQKAFEEIKALMVEDCLCRYPDANKPFAVYTDASDYQLGAVIMQEGLPVAYYSRKLNAAQQNYTTIEKELLSVVETFREFREILYGAPEIQVFTDHRNLTYSTLNSQRVLRWRLYIEEFGPKFHYVKGQDNVLADAFSRLPSKHSEVLQQQLNLPNPDSESFFSILDDEELLECFLNHPDPTQVRNPLDYAEVMRQQTLDLDLQEQFVLYPQRFQKENLAGYDLLCYVPTNKHSWRIAIPTTILQETVRWYHQFLNHVGASRLLDTIAMHSWHPKLRLTVEEVVSKCDPCQRYKSPGQSYGELPVREAVIAPWTEVAVDLIGPWKIKIGNRLYHFQALTCIDPATGFAELIRIRNRSSEHVAILFENQWLSRYPRPERCIHDNGGEFIGWSFQQMLQNNQIKDVPTTVKNPQANAICERMHQTVGNVLRTLLHVHPPANVQQANDLIDSALATAQHALRSTVHRTLQMSPGAVVFHRDMLLNIPLLADLQAIHAKRQLIINENLRKANQKRRSHDYHIEEQVMVLEPDPSKLQGKAHGPYTIQRVHANGTVTLQITPTVTERINIRRIKPYHSEQ